jgi:hypothetical protein
MLNPLLLLKDGPSALRRLPFALFIFVLCAGGCGERKDIVASVGKQVITVEDFRQFIFHLKRNSGAPLSSNERQSYLKLMIQQKAVILAAQKEGIADVISSSAPVTEMMRANQYYHALEAKLQPPYADVRKYYEQHRNYFDQPLETGHLLHLRTLEEAQKAQALLASRLSFEDVAWKLQGLPGPPIRDLSQVLPFRKGDRMPDFEQAFFTLEPGQTSGIVPVLRGFEIIQRGTPGDPLAYSDMLQNVRMDIVRKVMQQKIQETEDSLHVRIYEKRLADLEL